MGKAVRGIVAAVAALVIGYSIVAIVAKADFRYERIESCRTKTTFSFQGEVRGVKAEGDAPASASP